MTTIPFKLHENRLYFDDEMMNIHPQLTRFINQCNMKTPGMFVRDKDKGRVYFYPPENYTMPPLPEHNPQLKQGVSDHQRPNKHL